MARNNNTDKSNAMTDVRSIFATTGALKTLSKFAPPWRAEHYHLYPKELRDAIVTTMMVWKFGDQKSPDSQLPHLPLELLHLLFEFLVGPVVHPIVQAFLDGKHTQEQAIDILKTVDIKLLTRNDLIGITHSGYVMRGSFVWLCAAGGFDKEYVNAF